MLNRNNGNMSAVFDSVDTLASKSLRDGVRAELITGERYKITSAFKTGAIVLANGLYAVRVFDIGDNSGGITTSELILSNLNPSSGDYLQTTGYSSPGDGGAGNWVFNGVTGQTPSQSPVDLQGSILTDASGNQFSLDYTVIIPQQLGAVSGDASDVLNLCFKLLRDTLNVQGNASTSVGIDGLNTVFSASQSIDATKLIGWSYVIENFTLLSSATGKIALDFIGSRGGTLRNVLVDGDVSNTPNQGIVMARSADTSYGFCNNWTIDTVSTNGWFTIAGGHFYGQESTLYSNCKFWNNDKDGRGSIFTGYNPFTLVSDYETPTTGAVSYINNVYDNVDTRSTPRGRTGTITNITNAASAVVTMNTVASYTIGDSVVFAGVGGMTEINDLVGVVTNIAGLDVTVDIDSSVFGVYTSGGTLPVAQTVPTMYLDRAAGHTFQSLYVVSYGQPHIEVGFPDSEPPRNIYLENALFEGSGNEHNVLFASDAPNRAVNDFKLTTYNSSATVSIVTTNDSNGVYFRHGCISVSSVVNGKSDLLFDDESKYSLMGFDISHTNAYATAFDDFVDYSGTVFDITSGTTTVLGCIIGAAADGDYTPVLSAASGALTSYTINSATYHTIGNLVFVKVDATIDDAGTGAAALSVTLPTASASGQVLSGIDGTAMSLVGRVNSGGTMTVRRYNAATVIATGAQVIISGTYSK